MFAAERSSCIKAFLIEIFADKEHYGYRDHIGIA